jgi:hypothetical protein
MCGKSVSKNGKRVSGASMSDTALNESIRWTGELMDAEWSGRGDREKTVRYRLAKKIGVAESYLFRLQYKADEMNDVRGSVYRALLLGRRLYGLACEGIENTADRIDREAQGIEETNAALSSARPTVAGRQQATPRAPQ